MSGHRQRLRSWMARAKAAPARIDRLHADRDAAVATSAALTEELRQVRAAVERAERREADLDLHLGWVAGELALVRRLIGERSDVLEATVTGRAAVLARVATGDDRRRRYEALTDALGPSPLLRPGLTIVTVAWNHAGFLDDSVGSGLAALDALPPDLRGEVLVFDDASTDETAAATDRLAALDPRVRVVRSPSRLGAAWGRNALLHTTTTSHAFLLDADNRAEPHGVAALFEVATGYGAASVYGTVIKVGPDDRAVGVMSNEPITPAFFASNYVDTMGVVDVAQLRSVGGWPTDPATEHLDDWMATHALLRHGRLVGFVPVLAGRYRVLEGGMNTTVPDSRIGPGDVARAWNSDGRLTADRMAAFAAHPVTGPMWATPAAIALRPDLDPTTADFGDDGSFAPAALGPRVAVARSGDGARGSLPVASRSRVLVVAPGGVGNVGDDAITAAVVARLGRLIPAVAIDVVTDGPSPVAVAPAVWRATVVEAGREPVRAVIDPAGYLAAVFAGGGSLTSRWRSGLIDPRLGLARRLTDAGVPYVMSGLGVGPLDTEADRAAVAELVGGAERVALRDEGSAGLCRALGVQPARPVVTGDDALGLNPVEPAELADALAKAGLDEQPYLAVTARIAPYVGDPDLDAWADAVDRLAAERGLAVLGVALNDTGPEPEAARLATLAHGGVRRRASWHVLSTERDPCLLAAAMAGAEAAAVHSYHAALFALAGGRPVVFGAATEYYLTKAEGLAGLAGLPDAFVVRPGEPLDLGPRLDAMTAALAAGASLSAATDAVEAWWRTTVATALAPPPVPA